MYAISVKVVAGWSIAVRCRLQNRQNQGTFFDSGWTRPNDRECSAEAADTCKLLFLVMFHIYSSISSSFSLSSFLSLSLSSNVSWVRELISYSSNFTLLLLYRNKTKTTVQKSVKHNFGRIFSGIENRKEQLAKEFQFSSRIHSANLPT